MQIVVIPLIQVRLPRWRITQRPALSQILKMGAFQVTISSHGGSFACSFKFEIEREVKLLQPFQFLKDEFPLKLEIEDEEELLPPLQFMEEELPQFTRSNLGISKAIR
jgi:hypothetical protein